MSVNVPQPKAAQMPPITKQEIELHKLEIATNMEIIKMFRARTQQRQRPKLRSMGGQRLRRFDDLTNKTNHLDQSTLSTTHHYPQNTLAPSTHNDLSRLEAKSSIPRDSETASHFQRLTLPSNPAMQLTKRHMIELFNKLKLASTGPIIEETLTMVLKLQSASYNKPKQVQQICFDEFKNLLTNNRLKLCLLALDPQLIATQDASSILAVLNRSSYSQESLDNVCEGLSLIVQQIRQLCEQAVQAKTHRKEAAFNDSIISKSAHPTTAAVEPSVANTSKFDGQSTCFQSKRTARLPPAMLTTRVGPSSRLTPIRCLPVETSLLESQRGQTSIETSPFAKVPAFNDYSYQLALRSQRNSELQTTKMKGQSFLRGSSGLKQQAAPRPRNFGIKPLFNIRTIPATTTEAPAEPRPHSTGKTSSLVESQITSSVLASGMSQKRLQNPDISTVNNDELMNSGRHKRVVLGKQQSLGEVQNGENFDDYKLQSGENKVAQPNEKSSDSKRLNKCASQDKKEYSCSLMSESEMEGNLNPVLDQPREESSRKHLIVNISNVGSPKDGERQER